MRAVVVRSDHGRRARGPPCDDDPVSNAGGEPKRGALRIYLGAAPGVGKTFAMLNEGRRRRERGTDVVVGFVETHGRARTAEQIGDLEVVPRRTVEHRGSDARPRWTSTPSSPAAPSSCSSTSWPTPTSPGRATRSAGRTSTSCWPPASTSSRRSTSSTSSRSTTSSSGSPASTSARRSPTTPCGPPTRSSSSTWRRRRCAGGSPTATSTAPTRSTPRSATTSGPATWPRCASWRCCGSPTGSTTGCRTTASGTASRGRGRRASASSWRWPGAPDTDHLVRRAARIAQRAKGDLIGVHVVADTGLQRRTRAGADVMAAQRQLLEELGGEYRRVTGNDVASALVDLARAENATQIVLGASGRSRWRELFSGSVINRVVRLSGPIDVHVISRPPAEPGDAERRLPPMKQVLTPLSPRRQLWGWAVAVAGLPLITLTFANTRDTFGLTSVLLLLPRAGDGRRPRRRRPPGRRSPWSAGSCSPTGSSPRRSTPSTSPTAENVLALVVYVVAAGHRRRPRRPRRAQPAAGGAPAGRGRGAGRARRIDGSSRLRRRHARPAAHDVRVPDRCAPHARRDRLAGARQRRARAAREPRRRRRQPRPRPRRHPRARRRRAVRRGRTGAERLRRPGRRGGRARAAARPRRAGPPTWRRRTPCGPACCRRCRTTCGRRWPSIKASISSLRQRDIDWSPAAVDEFQATIEEETDRLDRHRRQPPRHEPGAGVGAERRRRADRGRGGRPGGDRERRTGRAAASRSTSRSSCRTSSPTPPCWSGRSPTSSATPCATRRPASRSASSPATSWWTAMPHRRPGDRPRPGHPAR